MNKSDEQPSLSNLDAQLKQLAIAAQQYPKQSKQRQLALTRLLTALTQSRKLIRPRRDQFQGLYEEIYLDAVQRLFSYVAEKIDIYNPQRGEVLQWANFLLNQRFFIEASRELLPTVYKGMDPRQIMRLTLEDLDRKNPSELNPHLTPSLSQEVEQCLMEDPDGIFAGTYIVDRPDANFRFLALQRFAGYSWQELSTELRISIPTLSSFYQRCLTKFAAKFKDYLLS